MPQEEKSGSQEVSLYKPGEVSAEAFAHGARRIKDAFPKLPANWYSVLEEMIDEERFDDLKFKDAVINLIKTCPYPEPTIANILGYDKKVRIYSYQELLEKHNKDHYPGTKFSMDQVYQSINLDGMCMYVKKQDFNPVRFQKWGT